LNIIERICEIGRDTVVIPDSVWNHPDLKPTDIKLYKVLLDFGKTVFSTKGKTDKFLNPIIDIAQAILAEKVGVTVKTLHSCLARLKEVGLVTIEDYRGFKRNNLITIVGGFFGITAKESKTIDKSETVQKASDKLFEVKEERRNKRAEISQNLKTPKRENKPDKDKKEEETGDSMENNSQSLQKDDKLKEYEAKLRELGGFTPREKAIIGVAKHYEMLVCKHTKKPAHRSLSKKNPMEHKNWKRYEKFLDLCDERGWDANLFLECQFEVAKKYWTGGRYPYVNMICSEKAQQSFEWFLRDRKEKYALEAKKFNSGATKTKSMKKVLMEEIVYSAKFLPMYIDQDGDEQQRKEDKAMWIYNSWESFAPAYLWSIPWFRQFIKELQEAQPEDKKVASVVSTFEMINKSKRLQEVVLKTVEVVERQLDIPGNLDI